MLYQENMNLKRYVNFWAHLKGCRLISARCSAKRLQRESLAFHD